LAFFIIKGVDSKINFGMNFVVFIPSLVATKQVQKVEMRDAEWEMGQ
jgi:hypothetical protein